MEYELRNAQGQVLCQLTAAEAQRLFTDAKRRYGLKDSPLVMRPDGGIIVEYGPLATVHRIA